MKKAHDKIYWHEAFCEALRLELSDYDSILEYVRECQLSKEALEIDAMVLKKSSDENIEENIGQIFKGHNIFEFKSETDYFSCWDYCRAEGYALIYASFEKVFPEDITMSVVVTKYTDDLFKYLKDEKKYEVKEVFSGIHHVIGGKIPIQILESKRLSSEDDLFLKSLRSNLDTLHEQNKKSYTNC